MYAIGLGSWFTYTNRFFDENVVFLYKDKRLKTCACTSIEGDLDGKIYVCLDDIIEGEDSLN